jgi:hypothetical protein
MVIKMMILTQAIRTQIKNDMLGRYIRSKPVMLFNTWKFNSTDAIDIESTNNIYTYYVDVEELHSEILKNENTALQ